LKWGDVPIGEEKIIKSIQNGNLKVFEFLVDKYKNIVYSLCYGVVRDPHAAADISQEVFIKAYLSIGSYQNQGFKTWISRISINKSIDYVRKMAKEQANCTYQKFPTSASQSLEEQSQEPTHHETPESVFFKKILREEIKQNDILYILH